MVSCEKFLDEKSNQQLAIPNTIEDFQALLYNNDRFFDYANSGELSSDDLYITDADFDGLYLENDKRLYTWQPDHVSKYIGQVGNNWKNCYATIYVANAVLHGIKENNLSGNAVDEVTGQALTLRAARYLDGVQIWAPVYDRRTGDTDLGMVIRLDPDMNLPSVRASVQQTYDQIIKDLSDAIPLLPVTSVSPNIPTKAAAYGLLARTYLIMADYEKALENAEHSLQYNSTLIDFNELNANDNFPITGTKTYAPQELIFLSAMSLIGFDMHPEVVKVTPALYNLYQTGDLRKTIFFQQNADLSYLFKGTHISWNLLTGITTAELLLILAECQARLNNISGAETALNKLRMKRWDPEYYMPYIFSNKDAALEAILQERRRELAFRGLRWSDIKRLNRDGANIILTRTVKGETYTLHPNDKRYAIAIPEDIIDIANIPQNPR